MKEWYDVKDRGIMGSAEEEIKEIVILGRLLRWKENWVEYEADPKHREVLVREFGLAGNSKAATSPGVKEKDEGGNHEELTKQEATWFRSMAARANYLGADRGDIQVGVKEACRGMASPTWGDVAKLKRVVRYLVGAERIVWRYRGGGAVKAALHEQAGLPGDHFLLWRSVARTSYGQTQE